jgi:hypothetical protein
MQQQRAVGERWTAEMTVDNFLALATLLSRTRFHQLHANADCAIETKLKIRTSECW